MDAQCSLCGTNKMFIYYLDLDSYFKSAVHFRTCASPCGIDGRQSGTGTGFLWQILCFSPVATDVSTFAFLFKAALHRRVNRQSLRSCQKLLLSRKPGSVHKAMFFSPFILNFHVSKLRTKSIHAENVACCMSQHVSSVTPLPRFPKFGGRGGCLHTYVHTYIRT